MNEQEKRDLELKKKFPKILRDLYGDPSKTGLSRLHGGIAIGDGWIPLLESLMTFLQFHHDQNGYPQVVATQIKEKFGTLCFYYTTESDTLKNNRSVEFLDGAIDFVEYLSSKICEHCGKPAKQQNKSGWVKTICNECNEK